MTSGSFFDRIDELDRQVGHDDLEMVTTVDQIYAKYQELRDDLRHPNGGQAHYARDGLLDHADGYMQKLADGALEDLSGAAIHVVDEMGHNIERRAPIEYSNLNRSAAGKVLDNGAEIYNRPPDVPRLSEEQLRAQRRHGHAVDYGADTRPRLS